MSSGMSALQCLIDRHKEKIDKINDDMLMPCIDLSLSEYTEMQTELMESMLLIVELEFIKNAFENG